MFTHIFPYGIVVVELLDEELELVELDVVELVEVDEVVEVAHCANILFQAGVVPDVAV